MKRRDFIGLLGGAVASPYVAWAQQSVQIARVGFLSQAGPQAKLFEAFRGGLRAAGYFEGQNILIEPRYAGGAYERLNGLAAQLASLNMDVIAVDGPAAAKACKGLTASIPVVFTLEVDPVADGLALNLANPGGNFTGFTMAVGYGVAGKQVELLGDMVARLSRVAVLSNPSNPPSVLYLRETERTAAALGLELRAFEAREPSDLSGAFTAMADWRADGLVTLADGMLFNQRERVVEFALKSKLPGVYPEAEWVESGGLGSYGPSLPDLFRRTAGYVDKILKGAKPSDLPIQQPTKFELVVNLKTAKAIGLVLPSSLIGRADEVIE